jgi:translation initiation factor 5
LEAKRLAEEAAAAEAAAAESSEEEEDERIAKVRAYAAKHDDAETAAYLVSDALGADSPALGIHFLVEAIFDDEKPLAPQVKAKIGLLKKACAADAPALQLALLCAIELYVTETATTEFKKIAVVLKELYDGDAAEEDVILTWGAKTAEAVRKQAAPFLEWLQQSDEDSDSD